MNVDTVETVTGGTQSDSPDFAQIVNDEAHWEQYGQKTWDATSEGYIFSRVSKDGKTPDESEQKFHWNDATRTPYYGWWGTALINNDEYDANNINAKFHVVRGGNLNEGFAFALNKDMSKPYKPTKQDGSVYDNNLTSYPLSGYFMTYSHHNASNESGGRRVLWRIDNWRLDNSFSSSGSLSAPTSYSGGGLWCRAEWGGNPTIWTTPGTTFTSPQGETATCLATWNNSMDNVDYEVDFRDGRIQIWDTDKGVTTKRVDLEVAFDEGSGSTSYLKSGTTNKVATVAGKAPIEKGTYGFWGNNCEMMQFAQVSKLDIQIEKITVKSFGDIVYEPSWTDGALHMLINIDTKADKTMLGTDGGVGEFFVRRPPPGRRARRAASAPLCPTL